MSSQEGRIKIEHLLRQLEHVVEVDWPEAPTHGTVPDDRGRNEKGEKVQGKEPQKNEHAAPEEPLAQLARACSLESAEQASANRRAGDAAIGAEEDSDAEVGSDEDDEDGGEGGADERDFVVDEEDYEGGAAGSGGSASRQGTDADRRSQVWLFPRRKNGQGASTSTEKGRPPLKVGIESIQPLFGLPQKDAAKALGISLTALKQVCRKLGVVRWPYWRKKKDKGKGAGGGGLPSSDRAEMRPLACVAGVGVGAEAVAACGSASEEVRSRDLDAWHHSSSSSSSSSRTSLPAITGAAASSHSALSEARETAAAEALLAVSTGGTRRRAEGGPGPGKQ